MTNQGGATKVASAVDVGIGREVGPEGGGEVFPSGVEGFDEGDLLQAGPVFEFCLARKGVDDVFVVFVIDEAVDFVPGGVGAGARFAMGLDSGAEAIGHSDVEGMRAAGEDVDPEVILSAHGGDGIRLCVVRRVKADSLRE